MKARLEFYEAMKGVSVCFNAFPGVRFGFGWVGHSLTTGRDEQGSVRGSKRVLQWGLLMNFSHSSLERQSFWELQ